MTSSSGPDPAAKPSQAEGDRETVDAALGEQGQSGAATTAPEGIPDPTAKPSQAEGDRETVDADLDERGARGEG